MIVGTYPRRRGDLDTDKDKEGTQQRARSSRELPQASRAEDVLF